MTIPDTSGEFPSQCAASNVEPLFIVATQRSEILRHSGAQK